MTLGEIVKKYMEDNGLSGRELAKRSELSPQTVLNVINGTRTPDLATYQKLAKGMNMTAAELFAMEAEHDVDDDDELMEYLQELRTRPEMRMLFQTSRHMTKEQLQNVVAMLEGFKN